MRVHRSAIRRRFCFGWDCFLKRFGSQMPVPVMCRWLWLRVGKPLLRRRLFWVGLLPGMLWHANAGACDVPLAVAANEQASPHPLVAAAREPGGSTAATAATAAAAAATNGANLQPAAHRGGGPGLGA